MSLLHIYRASAGSGKTFTLTRRYLEKALADPPNFSRIAALTFTNKATAEMKARIFNTLNRLARAEETQHIDYLTATLRLTRDEVQIRADLLRRSILAEYKDFTVTTLDKFFQRILRAFAREINVDTGYEAELDYTKVMDDIVDRLTEDLRPGMPLTDWISEYLLDKLEEGKSRDFRSVIKKLGMKIFDEDFRAIAHELEQLGDTYQALGNFKEELYRHKKELEDELAAMARDAVAVMEKYDLVPADFKGGSKSPFNKLSDWADGRVIFPGSGDVPSKTFLALPLTVDNWFAKTSPKKEQIEGAYHNGLLDAVNGIIRFYAENETFYRSLLAASKNLFVFGIFSELVKRLDEYRQENNVLLLSDAVDLLRGLTEMDDAPFVYEKTGTRYDTYLLDEFQDTSGFQWDCTAPLVHNTLSEGHDNLLVGDPKQSIYRWRGGNRELINSVVPAQFPHEIHRLTKNYRSRKNIIGFNNVVFSLMPGRIFTELENDEKAGPEVHRGIALLRATYADVVQQWNEEREGGYVNLRFFEKDETEEEDTDTDAADRALVQTVKELQDRGFAAKDIAILVRRNAEAKRAADVLQAEKWNDPGSPYVFDILSDEASYLENSSALVLLIHAARFMLNPQDTVNNSGLLLEWNHIHPLGRSPQELLLMARHPEEMREVLPAEFTRRETELLRKAPGALFDSLVRIFGLYTRNDEFSYLAAFRDLLTEFSSGRAPDLNSFLEYWDDRGRMQSVKAPDDAEAIRIMTFHKCKGLEFEAVIIPYFSEKTDHGTTHAVPLWVRSSESPFDGLPYFPVNYGSGLKKTLFADTYFRERIEAVSDALNLAYVAFTRAKTELHVFAEKPKESYNGSLTANLGYLLYDLALVRPPLPEGEYMLSVFPAEESREPRLVSGSPQPFVSDEKPAERGTEKHVLSAYPNTETGERLRLRLRENPAFYSPERRRGILLHYVLGELTYADRIDALVEQLAAAGHLAESEKTEVTESLHRLLTDTDVQLLFSREAQIKTESALITPEGHLRVPDRIALLPGRVLVSDFKTGQKETAHIRQIREYIQLLQGMGYANVSGILLYTATGETEKIHA